MIVIYKKSFLKDLKNIDSKNSKKLKKVLEFLEVGKKEDIFDLLKVKKLKGFENYFRIRLGDYRIGMRIIGNELELFRFKHRKDIYKIFP